LSIDTGGVRVDSVARNSPADRAGIIAGDALLTIGNKPVDSADDLAAVADELSNDDSVGALVVRDSGRAFVLMKPAGQ